MNENLWNLFEAVVNVYEGFNLYYFIFAFLDYNFKSTKNKIIFSCGALLNTCIVFMLNALMFYEGIWGIAYMVFTFLYALLFVCRNAVKVFFATLLAYIWILSINAFTTVFISSVSNSTITDIYIEHNIERFIMILTVQLLVTYAYRITLKIFKRNGIQLQFQEWLLILVVFILSFSIIMLIHLVQLNYNFAVKHHNLLLLASFGLVVINVVCYYMIVRLSKANAVKIEHELLLVESNYRKRYAEDAKNQYEEIRRIRHDMKQSYHVIQQLVSDERYDELKQYLPQMNEQISGTESTITTNHAIVNAILNTKLSTAKKQGIKTLCNTVKDLHIGQIEEIDLCHLLGNLLDNSIEAAAKCPAGRTRYMEVSITERNQILLITVKNSYDSHQFNSALKTSKPNKMEHGFGIKTIKRIAKKYQGFADFYTEDTLFCCNITLQMQ